MDWSKILPAILGLVRQGLAGVGVYIIAKGYADAAVWDGVMGLVMAAVGFGWGFFTKTNGPESVLSLIRTTFSAVAGYLVFRGWISSDTATQIIAVVMGLIPAAWTVQNKVSK